MSSECKEDEKVWSAQYSESATACKKIKASQADVSVTSADVSEYYGKILSDSSKLQTNSASCSVSMPKHVRKAMANVHPEVTARYFGCGVVIPTSLRGKRVLDLGSGSGRDSYVLAQLVGEEGQVVGVDMTKEQVELAQSHVQWHANKFGFQKPNTVFLQGYIEKLKDLNLADDSFDVAVSNCVINLCPDKAAVFREVFRVLKPGGELYFSDVYADRRMPQALRDNKVLWGECVSGALYWRDFYSLVQSVGFLDARLVTDRPITITNPKLQALVADYRFFSATFRLFKLPGKLEAGQEDYGLAVRYKGTVEEMPTEFTLDAGTHLAAGQLVPVSSNSWHMLRESRLAAHFDFVGSLQQHRGPFTMAGGLKADGCPFQSANLATNVQKPCCSMQKPAQDAQCCQKPFESQKSTSHRRLVRLPSGDLPPLL
eukprot:gb/GEZN01004500.1/.p1 GENE.gb/GEZN01004500.1/~~gb/GEZN01004500.1/.p1  ORF type:complete len:429 (+),score=70.77 gb/GEZN01004500.1/:254-1540(+)